MEMVQFINTIAKEVCVKDFIEFLQNNFEGHEKIIMNGNDVFHVSYASNHCEREQVEFLSVKPQNSNDSEEAIDYENDPNWLRLDDADIIGAKKLRALLYNIAEKYANPVVTVNGSTRIKFHISKKNGILEITS